MVGDSQKAVRVRGCCLGRNILVLLVYSRALVCKLLCDTASWRRHAYGGVYSIRYRIRPLEWPRHVMVPLRHVNMYRARPG